MSPTPWPPDFDLSPLGDVAPEPPPHGDRDEESRGGTVHCKRKPEPPLQHRAKNASMTGAGKTATWGPARQFAEGGSELDAPSLRQPVDGCLARRCQQTRSPFLGSLSHLPCRCLA